MTTPTDTTSAAPVADAATPPIPEPVWHEYVRAITVQAYQVVVDGHQVITLDGLQTVAAGNWVVNEGGWVSIVDDDTFTGLYPDAIKDDVKAPAK